MKELKLLPEDWKSEIDYSKAAFLISETGKHYMKFYHDKFIDTAMKSYEIGDIKHEITSVYEAKGLKLVELAPEPRPADSIKLSECDGKHLITSYCHYVNLSIRFEYGVWVARDMDGGVAYQPSDILLLLLMEHCLTDDIKIFDITQ